MLFALAGRWGELKRGRPAADPFGDWADGLWEMCPGSKLKVQTGWSSKECDTLAYVFPMEHICGGSEPRSPVLVQLGVQSQHWGSADYIPDGPASFPSSTLKWDGLKKQKGGPSILQPAFCAEVK